MKHNKDRWSCLFSLPIVESCRRTVPWLAGLALCAALCLLHTSTGTTTPGPRGMLFDGVRGGTVRGMGMVDETSSIFDHALHMPLSFPLAAPFLNHALQGCGHIGGLILLNFNFNLNVKVNVKLHS